MAKSCRLCGKFHGKTRNALVRPGKCPSCGHDALINSYGGRPVELLGEKCLVCHKLKTKKKK